jgi:hypothetical protein
MKVLFDECVDERLRLSFPKHDCFTVRFSGFAGLKNGRLLAAAEAEGFDVLITVDQELPNQQNLRDRRVAILILCAATNRIRDLLLLVDDVDRALESIKPGEVVVIRHLP